MGQAEETRVGLPTELNRMGLGPLTGKTTNWKRPLIRMARLTAGTMEATVRVHLAKEVLAKGGHAKVALLAKGDHAKVALVKSATRATKGTRELRMTTTVNRWISLD